MTNYCRRIFTNFSLFISPTWENETIFFSGYKIPLLEKIKNRYLFKALYPICQCYYDFRTYLSLKIDDTVIFRYSFFHPCFILLSILFGKRVKRFYLIEILFEPCTGKNIVQKMLSRINGYLLKCLIKKAEKIIVWSKFAADFYAAYFNDKRDKWINLPFYNCHYDDIAGSEGSYVFAGGTSERDYDTLIKVAEKLPDVKFVIASWDKFKYLPPNVEAVSAEGRDFHVLMARSAFVVLPLKKLTRPVGEQTSLSAMHLGKCLIVSAVGGAVDYIRSYNTGILVEPENEEALTKAIKFCVDPGNRQAVIEIGKRAKLYADENHDPEKVARKILDMVKTDGD